MPATAAMKTEFAVHLDGARIGPEEAAAISGIRVHQTRAGASSFELVVSDPELRWQSRPTFTECRDVRIELGVPGKLVAVFDGEVTAWRTELERNGPSVLVLRGLDRSHRLMRGHRTKTWPQATPLDVATQIASDHGLSPVTRAGSPQPVQAFRLQANESDFAFLRKLADREGYWFWVDGQDLHFERPQLSSTEDFAFTFGEDLETFLPTANFRAAPASVEAQAWDSAGKVAVSASAGPGQEIWTLPGGRPGSQVSRFGGSQARVQLVDSQIASQQHAQTIAAAALTQRSMEFLTAEVEVRGDPRIRPGTIAAVRKVGAYSGLYLVTEANHFYDSAGYHVICYVARDKWGAGQTAAQRRQARQQPRPARAALAAQVAGSTTFVDLALVNEAGAPAAGAEYEVTTQDGRTLRGRLDGRGEARVFGVGEGTCQVGFPERPADGWKTL